MVVETSLGVQMMQFLESGLLTRDEQPEFLEAKAAVIRLRGSIIAEVVIAIVALAISVTARVIVSPGHDGSTWERLGDTITPAGWW